MPNAAAEIEALRAALARAEARAETAEGSLGAAQAEAAHAKAILSGSEALIAHLRLEIEKLRRELYGQRSERKQRLLEQMELRLEEVEATASEDEALAEMAAAKAKTTVAAFERAKPARKPFPEHLPRERVVLPTPCACAACGSTRLTKMGEDVTETLEVIPRSWKVIQTVREKLACRDCERISQPPAPFHPTPRGWAGPGLLAMILFEKFGQHQPLNRQAERYAREGVELSLSTLADQVGAAAAALAPLHALIAAHVMAAQRLHGDDTTVPLLARGKTETARLWTYVRDDRPFGGRAPPAVLFRFSRDRRGEHPQGHLQGWAGILQADAYAGFNALFGADRRPGPIVPALCWGHARRKFFELADIAASARRGPTAGPISPLALEAVKRIDAVFDLERAINGLPANQRLHAWMTAERAKLSKHAPVAKAMDYMLTRWERFTPFLKDGRVCLSNNAAERSLRGAALGRKAWLFAGSERGGERAAFMYTLIATAKLNDVDPQAWLADVLARIAGTPMLRLSDLLPWNWEAARQAVKAA
jgi:transposase